MYIRKEQYRDFDLERLIYKGGEPQFDAFPTADAGKEAKEGKEKTETPEEKASKVEDKSSVIKVHRDKAMDQIRFLSYRGASAKKIADKWKAHATARFDLISKEYNAQRESKGYAAFDNSELARGIEQKAVKLFQEIKGRMDTNRDKYIRHQSLQDRIDQAKEDMKNPEKKERAERQLKAAKESIILDYLNANEDTKGISQPMKEMLARFIVEGNLVQLEYADIDADLYKDNVDDYFRHVEGFHEQIGQKLEGKLEAVVKRFLAEAPSPEAKKGEIALLKSWILSKDKDDDPFKAIRERLGKDPKDPDSMIMDAVNILAKKYDIRFKDGKMTHATIVTEDGGLIVYTPEEFKERIRIELSGPEYSTPDKLEDYAEEIDDKTEYLRDLRGEIDEGLQFVYKGGEINSWDDWEGHEAATALMTMSKKVRTQTEKLDEKARQQEAQERAEQAKEELKKGLSDELVEAGMKDHGEAMKKAGYEVQVTQPNFEGTGPAKMEYKWTKAGETVTVSVDYTKKDGAKFTVHMKRPETEEDNGFDAKLTYNSAADFKKLDLTTIIKEKEAILDKNNQIVTRVYLRTKEAGEAIEDLQIPYALPTEEAKLQPEFKVENPKLLYKDQDVGHLEYTPPTEKDKDGTFTLYIDGEKVGNPFKPDQLEAKLKQRVPKMKEVSERAEKNKKEIIDKWNVDVKTIKPLEGLTFNPVEKIDGEFRNANAEISLANFTKSDKSEAASLYIKVGSNPEERKYILKVGEKKHEFANIDDVNKYLETNRADLAKVPEKPAKPPKLREGGEAAKKNLSQIVMKLWGDKMAGIKPEDPQFNAALNTFINKLTVQRLNELKKPDAVSKFTLTQIEQRDLQDAFAKAYGFDKLEAVDEKEVKALNDMEVKIGDKTQKFSEAFGTNFAKVLSMHLEIKAGNKPGEIQVKDGDKFVSIDAKGLAKYVPAKLRGDYEKILKGETVDGFDKKAADELKSREAMKEIRQILRDPKKVKAFGQMGLPELVASLGQLWKMFQEAMKTGDFKTLQDGLDDLNKGRNPGERMESAKEAYSEAVDKIEDTGELMDLFNEPYGDKAKALFEPNGKAAIPYRIQLKTVIEEKMEKSLGVDISGMEKKSGGLTEIRASRGADLVLIRVERSGSQTFVTMDKVKTRDNGSEYTEPAIGKSEVKNLDSGDKSLGYVLFKKSPNITGSEKSAESAERVLVKIDETDYEKLNKADKEVMDKAPKEDKDKAREAYKEGDKLIDQKKYTEAIVKYKESQNAYPHHNAKYKIALCYDQLGNKGEALRYYKSYINSDMTPKFKEEQSVGIANAKKRAGELEQELGIAPVGTTHAIAIPGKGNIMMKAEGEKLYTWVYKHQKWEAEKENYNTPAKLAEKWSKSEGKSLKAEKIA